MRTLPEKRGQKRGEVRGEREKGGKGKGKGERREKGEGRNRSLCFNCPENKDLLERISNSNLPIEKESEKVPGEREG